MFHPFIQGQLYSRPDVLRILGLDPLAFKGKWATGYVSHSGDWFIFCNVGVPGRSGHNYANEFIGDDLIWYGKTDAQLRHPSIQSMLTSAGEVYIFARKDSLARFTFLGRGRAKSTADTVPVTVTWSFAKDEQEQLRLPEEVAEPAKYIEGAVKQITVNSYERNPSARQKCIEHYGTDCVVCGFSFKLRYGKIGEGYIHVHHLTPLADIGESYEVDPITDLRPVCSNCHAMIHEQTPPYTIEELRSMLSE